MDFSDGVLILISSSYPDPNLFLSVVSGPIHFKDPATYIAILEHNSSASSIVWVVRRTEDYFLNLEILSMIFHINLLASGSIPAEGSSKNITGGFPINAIATYNFLLLPPDKLLDTIFLYAFKPISFILSSTIIFLSYFGIPLIVPNNYKCSSTVSLSIKTHP